MTLRLTHTEAETVRLTKDAIAAMNALVIHITRTRTDPNHTGLDPSTINRILEADRMLNSAEDDFINDDPSCFLT